MIRHRLIVSLALLLVVGSIVAAGAAAGGQQSRGGAPGPDSLRLTIGEDFPQLVELRGADRVTSIDMIDRPLRRVLERLAQIGGFDIDTSALDASQRVSFTVRNTRVAEALAMLARSERIFYQVSRKAASPGLPDELLVVEAVRHVGGGIQAPEKIVHVSPAYPEAARAAKLAGVVILEARIGLDGAVEHVSLLRGIDPLLDESAAEAVEQWRYTPVLHNGVPVKVLLTVTVQFQIQ